MIGSVVFEARRLGFSYPASRRPAVSDVDLTVAAATLDAVIGPNGSGKSTLARLLIGTLRPTSGRALYLGRDAHEVPRDEIARSVGVVPQSEMHAFPVTVRELVAMGRYPHIGSWRAAGAADREAVREALVRCEVADLAERLTASLSGGERQRVLIARALAQEPRTLVLDEPTASLDVRHEMGIFELLRRLCDEGVTIVLVTHNLNLAARYADRLVLMDRGTLAAAGPAREVLGADRIREVYGWPVAVRALALDEPDSEVPQVVPLRGRGS